eukprot:TRINITY_DN461_c0_g1_i1.p1 TRINITY_DN461_c0_g1~~TRINITY_DN461_c0_g1_i1.p1  ORF type:complete len:529 (-),score=151.91 TRINITY_DN461_c0_g1_i1:69-1538(-)
MKVESIVLFVALLMTIASGASPNFLSNTLGSNMVLQRSPVSAQVWGWTQKGAITTLKWGRLTLVSTADNNGWWLISLPPTPASGPHKLSFTSTVGDSKVLENVMFGDVFFCSGQSNMEMAIRGAFNATAEVALADKYPNIRLFTAEKDTSDTPINQLKKARQPWVQASSKTVAPANVNDAWSYTSAACWFFGRNVFENTKVPTGLVISSWGGTIIEAWMSPDALSKCPKPMENTLVEDPNPNRPNVLWNSMIVPFLNMRVSGFAWYQGESNVGHNNFYRCAFPSMIKDWRKKFSSSPDTPFYFVQLSTWLPGQPEYNIPDMRLAQTAALSLPNVGMAVACDLGDADSPFGNIHPRNKQEVGRRLALNALAIQYKRPVIYRGPTATNVTVVQEANGMRIDVVLDPKTLKSPIELRSPPSCPNPAYCGSPAEVQGSDGKWLPAQISIGANKVTFKTGKMQVKGVRYAYSDWPMNTIYNKEGLPMPPFIFSL